MSIIFQNYKLNDVTFTEESAFACETLTLQLRDKKISKVNINIHVQLCVCVLYMYKYMTIGIAMCMYILPKLIYYMFLFTNRVKFA